MSDKSKFNVKMSDGFASLWSIYLFELALCGKGSDQHSFEEFSLQPELIEEYVSVYHQFYGDDKLSTGKTIDEVYLKISQLRKDLSSYGVECRKKYIAKKSEFKEAFDVKVSEATTCEYCGITLEQISLLAENLKIKGKALNRRYSLEIDRISPNQEYTLENIAMACYWCNNAKTDEFTREEFKPIADGIREVWNRRLRKIHPYSKNNEALVYPFIIKLK